MKNVLVVGGAGFIGSYLCSKLLDKGCKVLCLDNLLRGKISNISDLKKNKDFLFVKGDVNNEKKLIKLIEKFNIDFIFHLAANSDIQFSANNPGIEFECTAKTTWSVLSAMKKTGVKNLFFASTSAVYGEQLSGAFNEEDTLRPISYYGSAKMASEAFIRSFTYMNGFNSLVFRFPNVIGPNLTHGVFYDFIYRLKENPHELQVLGNGTQKKPYMHVSDLVSAIIKYSEKNVGLNIYNIGVDSATDVKTIAEMVVREMDLKDCKIKYGKENVGWKGDVPKFSYCLDKIHKTGWKPSMTSDEASLATIKEALGK